MLYNNFMVSKRSRLCLRIKERLESVEFLMILAIVSGPVIPRLFTYSLRHASFLKDGESACSVVSKMGPLGGYLQR